MLGTVRCDLRPVVESLRRLAGAPGCGPCAGRCPVDPRLQVRGRGISEGGLGALRSFTNVYIKQYIETTSSKAPARASSGGGRPGRSC